MPTISIIGRGLDPESHLSLLAINTLRLADKILGIETAQEFWKKIQKEFNILEVEDISYLYKNDELDLKNYNVYVNYIINLLKYHNHVALLIPGHPRLGVTFVNLLKRSAQGHQN